MGCGETPEAKWTHHSEGMQSDLPSGFRLPGALDTTVRVCATELANPQEETQALAGDGQTERLHPYSKLCRGRR